MDYDQMVNAAKRGALSGGQYEVLKQMQVKWLRDLLTETERERAELQETNARLAKLIYATEGELRSLRIRVAERDASVAHAIRRGR